jgi:hypothetical protein
MRRKKLTREQKKELRANKIKNNMTGTGIYVYENNTDTFLGTSSFATSASFAISASFSQTASYVLNAVSSSFATSASYIDGGFY